MVRTHIWLLALILAVLCSGCQDARQAYTPVAPTPPTAAETKAAADTAKEQVVTLQLTNAGLIKTAADADTQIAKLNAQLLANKAEQDALKIQNTEIRGAIKVVTAEKQQIIQAHDAFVAHLISGFLLLASVILGVFWWFAPAGLKDMDGKCALIAAGSGAVLYVVAAYIGWVIWVGMAILAGIGIYVLQRSHLLGSAFDGLIKDGHVVLSALGRAGWVQAVVDDVVKVLVKLHLRHSAAPLLAQSFPATAVAASTPAVTTASATAQPIPPAPITP